MTNRLAAFNLGPMLGRNSEEFKARWARIGVEARKASPYRCEATANVTGVRCGRLPAKGEKGYYRYCAQHLGGADRIAYDLEREARHKRTLALGDIPINEARARGALKQIANTRLRYAWRKQSPEIPGSTLILPDHIEPKILHILQQDYKIDIDAMNKETGHPFTPQCIDRLRHSAYRIYKRRNNPGGAGEVFESHIALIIRSALRREKRYFEKRAKLEASMPAWDFEPCAN
jgi:hypothetical protein